MQLILPNLIVGPITVVIGVLVVIFRTQVHDLTSDTNKTIFGKRAVEAAESKINPTFWVAFVGVAAIIIGALMISGGLINLFSA